MLELRKKMQETDFEITKKLSQNHRSRFKVKIEKKFHKNLIVSRLIFRIAASFLILFGLAYFFKDNFKSMNQVVKKPALSINELSPELGKIESYYTTAINYELANLSLSADNETLTKAYLAKVEILSKQYKNLNTKLLKGDFSEAAINNLINNLQMRLQLLLELKTQLNKTKSEENENKIL